jgi:hypothetical protein
MTNDNTTDLVDYTRSAALALWVGTAAGIVAMALHPTGRDVVHNASEGGANALVSSLHGLAILGEGLVLCGAIAIVSRLRARLDLALGAYVFFALAGLSVIVAAAASGFLSPSTVRGLDAADAADRAVMLNALHYTGLLNQAFAKIGVMFTAVALLLWSTTIIITKEFERRLAILGILLGAGMLIGLGSGYLRLNIHGYGLVVLGTGIWQVLIAGALWRERSVD